MSKNCTIVADASVARVFSSEKRWGPLTFVTKLDSSESRLKEQELVSDRPGRTFDSKGTGRHANDGDRTRKEMLKKSFARLVAEDLDERNRLNQLASIVVIAEPKFLGFLRDVFTDQVKEKVVLELPNNVTDRPVEEIEKFIASHKP